MFLYYLHVAAVCLSGGFFLVRGLWMLQSSPRLTLKLVRISPHIVDTVLLASAIGLCLQTGQYPITNDWLTVKLVALVGYIVLGTFALKRGRTYEIRATFFIAAILTFSFMVSVALTREPTGFLSLI